MEERGAKVLRVAMKGRKYPSVRKRGKREGMVNWIHGGAVNGILELQRTAHWYISMLLNHHRLYSMSPVGKDYQHQRGIPLVQLRMRTGHQQYRLQLPTR